MLTSMISKSEQRYEHICIDILWINIHQCMTIHKKESCLFVPQLMQLYRRFFLNGCCLFILKQMYEISKQHSYVLLLLFLKIKRFLSQYDLH